MSFNQAKELVEKLELSELALKKTSDEINLSTKNFNETLKKQEYVLKLLPQSDKKLNVLKMLVILNIGFILGLLAGAILFN